MRFIWQNGLTLSNLKLLSGDSELVVGTFFFWNSGVPGQESRVGLLRSLLFNVHKSQRNLIP
jgi:hypothetical protein